MLRLPISVTLPLRCDRPGWVVNYSVSTNHMPEPREDDLFRESTMTFGEHLEELRACLFKSIGGLLVGFHHRVDIGGHVVSFIQRPLSNALTTLLSGGVERAGQRRDGEAQGVGQARPGRPSR